MEILKDKIVYITGGSSGIGYGVARSLLNEGMKVAISSRKMENAQDAAEQLEDETGNKNILAIESDVRILASEEDAITTINEKWGEVEVLIANAGLGIFKSIYDLEPEDWKAMIDTNLTGVYHTTKAGLKDLKNTEGYLITLASLAGTNFFAKGAGYNASKFGVVGMTQAMMLDLRQDNIKVSTIMPGSVSTHFNGNNPSDEDNWKIQPEDIGQLVVDLLKMHPRTLPSKIEVRPSKPPSKK